MVFTREPTEYSTFKVYLANFQDATIYNKKVVTREEEELFDQPSYQKGLNLGELFYNKLT